MSVSRKRRVLNDDEYEDVIDANERWKSTSKWTSFQVERFRGFFENGVLEDIAGEFDISQVQLYPDAERILMPGIETINRELPSELPEQCVAFYNHLSQLSLFNDELPVDAVSHDLLLFTGFESQKLHFRPKPRLAITWREHRITSEADYGVYKLPLKGKGLTVYLAIVENKSGSKGWDWAVEHQLFGELVLAVVNRLSVNTQDQMVFGIVMQSSFLRFYSAYFPKEYLADLIKDKTPEQNIEIKRYPGTVPLDLMDVSEREQIVRILHAIRMRIESL